MNIRNALSQIVDIYVSKKDYGAMLSVEAKAFFAKHGGRGVLPLTQPTAGPVQKPQYEREEPEVIVAAEGNCGLEEWFNCLCDYEFRVYALYQEVGERYTKIRIQSCPDGDIEWDHERPFTEMNRLAGILYAMAGFTVNANSFTYKKPGRTIDEKRSIFIKADQLNWLTDKDGNPLLVGNPPRRKGARSHLIIADDGEVQVVGKLAQHAI